MQTSIDFTKKLIHKENNKESQKQFDANMDKFSNQCRTVYRAMMKGERLTTRIAILKYNILDLRRRIKDLKDTWNVPVKAEYVEGGYKEYYLELNN